MASGSGREVNCELECLYITFKKMALDVLRAAFPITMMDSTQLEFVQLLGIVYEDFLAHRSIRRPGGQEIEHKPVVDLPQRCHLRGAAVHRIRVWPVGAPQDAVDVGTDQHLGERREIAEVLTR